MYIQSNSGGTTKRYKSTFFGGMTNNTLGLSTKNSLGGNSEVFPISGLIFDEENNLEITLLQPSNVKEIDIFLSFSPGIKISINSIKLIDGNSNIIEVDTKKLTILSNNSFLVNGNNQSEIIVSSFDDEVINLSLTKEYKNISQIMVNAKFEKLKLINKRCE